MNRILLLMVLGLITYAADSHVSTPVSSDSLSGKSVYSPPSKAVEVVEEGCVQKEDQNITGHGGAKW